MRKKRYLPGYRIHDNPRYDLLARLAEGHLPDGDLDQDELALSHSRPRLVPRTTDGRPRRGGSFPFAPIRSRGWRPRPRTSIPAAAATPPWA